MLVFALGVPQSGDFLRDMSGHLKIQGEDAPPPFILTHKLFNDSGPHLFMSATMLLERCKRKVVHEALRVRNAIMTVYNSILIVSISFSILPIIPYITQYISQGLRLQFRFCGYGEVLQWGLG